MKKLVAGVVLGAVMFTAGAVFTASKSDDEVLRQTRDRQQIEELMWRYARALDTGNAEAYAALYTADGQFGSGANATKGREALKQMIAGPRRVRRAQSRPPLGRSCITPPRTTRWCSPTRITPASMRTTSRWLREPGQRRRRASRALAAASTSSSA